MYEDLGGVELANGDVVACGVVTTPDETWSERIECFLEHKGEIWRWHLGNVLYRNVKACHRFYVLHRDGVPLANILTATHGGVGSLGHVYTREADRRKGAASLLLGKVLQHARDMDVRMLLLGTDFGSSAYRIYAQHGFEGLGPPSGLMGWYAQSQQQFEAEWYAAASTRIEKLSWQHWCTAAPLFSHLGSPWIRVAGLQMFGPRGAEESLLYMLRDQISAESQPDAPGRSAAVVATRDDGAVLAYASWNADGLWPRSIVVDMHCHPRHADAALPLLEALPLPSSTAYEQAIAYSDAGDDVRIRTLLKSGFKQIARLPQFGRSMCDVSGAVDVCVFQGELA